MKLLTFARAHHLGKLHGELVAAIASLRPVNGSAVMTIAGDGQTLKLGVPDAFDENLLAPVLAAHDPTPPPPPVVYSGIVTLDARLRTTNASATELYRATLAALTGYRAALTLIAVDAGNGAVRTIEARITAKRLGGGALLVGSAQVVSDQQDASTSAWTITPSVSGNDFVITVAGAAGRNIDWLLSGHIVSFTPGGQP